MMSDNEKKAFRINTVDVIITIAIVLALVLFIMATSNSFGLDSFESKENEVIEYTVRFDAIRTELGNNVKAGVDLIDAHDLCNLGKVMSVFEPIAFQKEVYDEASRSIKLAEYPDYITLEITVRAIGYIVDDMHYLLENDRKISVGTELSIRTPDFCGNGVVTALRTN